MTMELSFSDDQAGAYDRVTEMLRSTGIDLDNTNLNLSSRSDPAIMAVIGKAGSGKTLLLASLYSCLLYTSDAADE